MPQTHTLITPYHDLKLIRVKMFNEDSCDDSPALWYTDKKEKKIFLIYKEIQMGAVAKSHLYGKGFLIYEEMRKYLVI
jgi:hypothetical protein